MKNRFSFPILVLLAGLTFHCQSKKAADETEQTAAADADTVATSTVGDVKTYGCNDNETFSVRFETTNGKKIAVFIDDGKEIPLDPIETASGSKYSDGKMSIWFKGSEALVEFKNETRSLKNCKTR
ncbi:MliC family protein [Larkinella soli]|uniref:MliC family protein n=1 Tax=Larkinella soli TaxID=1770527 RepID=UPI000FFCAF77|nr:MliC family protein [Larkinella soli]